MGKNKKKERNILYTRMLALGYDDVTEFARNSRIPLSFETCRRAIYDDRQNIRHDYVIVLMQFLDFTTAEIKDELLKRGDKFLHKLISDSEKGVQLNDQETVIIKGLRDQPEMVPVVTTILAQKANALKEAKKKG